MKKHFALALTFTSLLSSLAVAAPSFERSDASSASRAPRRVDDMDRIDSLRPMIPVVTEAQVREALAARRKASLAAFHDYRGGGVYPRNTYQPGKLNVWIDEDGRTCAAATIILRSGHEDLVSATAEQNNFIQLKDVRSGELMNWIFTSGLTQSEIVMIQEPFYGEGPDEGVDARRAASSAAAVKARQAEEDARLAAKYARIEATLRKQANASLTKATKLLMSQPVIAARLVAEFGEESAVPQVRNEPAPTGVRFAQPPA